MIIFVYIVLFILILIFNFFKHRNILTVGVLISFIWILCGIFIEIRFLPIIKPSIQVHSYIFQFLLIFNLIYLLFLKKNNRLKFFPIFQISKNKIAFLYIFNILAILIILPLTYRVAIFVIENGFYTYRSYIFQYIEDSHYLQFLYKNIIFSIFDTTALITAFSLATRKKSKLLIIMTIIGILLYTFTFGGRYSIFNFIIYYVSSVVIVKYRHNHFKVRYAVFGILALLLVTNIRGNGSYSILESIYLYFIGSFSYLQYILDHPIYYGLSDNFHGFLTFGFIFEPIVLTMKQFFGSNLDVPSFYFNIYAQQFVNIGDSNVVMYNNNSTMFYVFIRDFGNLGVTIGSIILSSVFVYFSNKFYTNKKIVSGVILVYLSNVIITGTMMYSLITARASISILIVLFILSGIKYKEVGEMIE